MGNPELIQAEVKFTCDNCGNLIEASPSTLQAGQTISTPIGERLSVKCPSCGQMTVVPGNIARN